MRWKAPKASLMFMQYLSSVNIIGIDKLIKFAGSDS